MDIIRVAEHIWLTTFKRSSCGVICNFQEDKIFGITQSCTSCFYFNIIFFNRNTLPDTEIDVNGFSQDLVLLVPFLHVPAMWIYPCRLPAPGKEVLAQAKPGTL